MHVLCTGFVGVSGKIGDVETQCGVVAQDTVEVAEEGPGERRAAKGGALGDDCAVADSAAGFVQCRAEDGQEDDWCNDRLEHEEVLNLDGVSQVLRVGGLGCRVIPLCKECTGMEVGAGSRAETQSFPLS